MLLGCSLLVSINQLVDFRDVISAPESCSLRDELLRRRFGHVFITSGSGFGASSSSRCVTALGSASPSTLFGLSYEHPTAVPSLCLILAGAEALSSCTVGAVLCYSRQPKHVRKNTGGKDWLRVSLQVRTSRSFRGLL